MEYQHHPIYTHRPDMCLYSSDSHSYQKRHRTATDRMVCIRHHIYNQRILAEKPWFQFKDLYFLFSMGGARTHIIWSGIRYFSCFTDAANYGVHCAMATVVFTISAFFVDSKWKRIYFLCIAMGGLYGGGISGTRAAMGSYHGRNADDNHFGQKLESAVGRHLCLYRSFLFFLFH